MEGSSTQSKSSTFTATIPPAASCPISMRAQHGVDGGMIAVSGAVHNGLGQQLKLTLKNPGNTTISAIRIMVHGWDGSLRWAPARTVKSNDTNASRTIEIKTPIAPHKTARANLWVSGLTSVESIDLIEVRYARGLSWRASASHACRILPGNAHQPSLESPGRPSPSAANSAPPTHKLCGLSHIPVIT